MQDVAVQKLFRALGEADEESVRSMVSENRSLLSSKDSGGRSLVLFAVYAGQPKLAWELVRLGAPEGIHEASALGDLNHASDLTRKDPSGVSSYSSDGWTPLHLSSFFGHPELTSFFVRHGAKIDLRSRNSQANLPIHSAVAGGHVAVVEVLLEAGADPVGSKGPGGTTPIHLAAQNGDLAMLELLLDKKGGVGVEDDQGKTPVDVARKAGHARAAEFLVRYGARELLSPTRSPQAP